MKVHNVFLPTESTCFIPSATPILETAAAIFTGRNASETVGQDPEILMHLCAQNSGNHNLPLPPTEKLFTLPPTGLAVLGKWIYGKQK